jgi:glycosyltransferase involved in cell wall biosynthesis
VPAVILGIDAGRAVGDRTGVGRNISYLLGAWSRQDIPFDRVRVFSPAPLVEVPADDRFALEVLRGPGTGLLWQALRLRPAAAGVDVLLGHYTLPPGYRGRGVVYNLGIYRGRFAMPGWRTRLRTRHFRASARRAAAVIANSESTKADVVRWYGVDPGRIRVVWPGAGGEFRPPRPGDEEATAAALERALGRRDVPYLLFVGKLSARRNIPALIESVAALRGRHPDLHLLIVGPNTGEVPVERLIDEQGLDGVARHVPFLDHDLLAPLYRGASAFVLPTEHEGFSHTIPEALASGCPVVTVDHAALDDAAVRDCVLVVPDPSPERLAAAVEQVLSQPDVRERLVRAGLETAKTLSWEQTARQTMAVLAEVARRRA